jgi:ubiquinone/menaquinone biosynthesis C-methylase UbiE
MPSMLRFDDVAARRTEAIYSTPDVISQRRWTRQTLSLRPGESVVDVGSGPGFLAAEMAAEVGPTGRVSGIDISEQMLAMARQRCSKLGTAAPVDFQFGDATKLPFPDESFNVAVSTQVFEYVADVDAALGEVRRVLRPGGRILVVDTDWDSIVWHGADPVLTAAVLAAWAEHLVDPHLPRTFAQRMHSHGFRVQVRDAYVVLNPMYDHDTYSYGLIGLIKSFVPGRQGITEEQVEAWSEQLHRAGDQGSYFFSLNRYLFLAVKDGS